MNWLDLIRVHKWYCVVEFHVSKVGSYYSADNCPKDIICPNLCFVFQDEQDLFL